MKCAEGDFRYCRVSVDLDSEQTQSDSDQWTQIYGTHIQKFGLNKDYVEYLRFQVKKANAQLKYLIDDSRFAQNEVRMYESKLKAIEDRMKDGVSYDEALVLISKKMGFYIDPMKVTASFYFNSLKQCQK